MLNESEIRAANLAVDLYKVDPVEVERVSHMLEDARARGDRVDLFDLLEVENLLSAQQVHDLRFGLDKTQVDPQGATPLADINLRKLRQLGDYRVLRLLGEGGMGAVFLAFHETENKQVALKVLSQEMARQQANLDRFTREGRSGAILNHPNIVRNLTFGQDRATSLHYLVLEYVEGSTAQELLEKQGRLTVGDALHIVLDVARALEFAHSRSVIHRDIKPANILVSTSGLAKLSDFGLAKRLDETSHLTKTKQGFGTPYYMPYEQAVNAKSADVRSDIYALGATLYHLVTGVVPFPGDNSMEIVDKKAVGFFLPASSRASDIPDVVDRVLSRMMAREPNDRYQTASEVIVDLERTNLAAPVLSFVSPGKALEDPHIRQRLTSPMQATVADLEQAPIKPAIEDLWFVRYRKGDGKWTKARLARTEIVSRWREETLSPDAGVSGSAGGPFLPLREVFSEIDPSGKMSAHKPRRRFWQRGGAASTGSMPGVWLIALLSLAGVTIALVMIVMWFVIG